MRRKITVLSAALAVATLISIGFVSKTDAGYKSYYGLQMSTTSRYAAGAIGLVRSGQPDNVQYIGCYVVATSSGRTATCSARDPSHNYGSCTTTSSNMINALQMMTTATYLYFSWDTNGNCTQITLENRSDHYPTSP